MTQVTLSKGGTAEQTVDAASIDIPDLWFITQRLDEADQDVILKVWHIAHDLKQHILDNDEVLPETLFRDLARFVTNGFAKRPDGRQDAENVLGVLEGQAEQVAPEADDLVVGRNRDAEVRESGHHRVS